MPIYEVTAVLQTTFDRAADRYVHFLSIEEEAVATVGPASLGTARSCHEPIGPSVAFR